jgi:5-methylcytosine-specific restriction endonuclease McrA
MSTKGLKFSDETKRKMSEARKGNKHPMFGKHHTEESKKKISEKKKGILPPQFKGYWTGRKQTPEHKAKSIKNLTHRYIKGQTAPMKGRKSSYKGEKHWSWKGGITKDKKYISWLKNLHDKRLKEAEGSHTYGEWQTLKAQYGFKCPMCDKLEPEIQLTQDHIIPLSKGGSDYIENIQPLCRSCNSKKSAKLIDKIQVTIIN